MARGIVLWSSYPTNGRCYNPFMWLCVIITPANSLLYFCLALCGCAAQCAQGGGMAQNRLSSMPPGSQNEPLPVFKFWKINNNHNNSHIAIFDAYFDDRRCIFQVSPACFLALNAVHLPRIKYPWHPGPTRRPQTHETSKYLPEDNRPTQKRGHAFVW